MLFIMLVSQLIAPGIGSDGLQYLRPLGLYLSIEDSRDLMDRVSFSLA